MKKSKKIRRIEKLFEGGPIDSFKLLHFLIMYGNDYKKLEFRTNSNEHVKIYMNNKKNKFLDIIDNKGNELIRGQEIELYHDIIEVAKNKGVNLRKKKFFINHVQ